MSGGGEPGHICADLGDDRFRTPLAHPGHGVNAVPGLSEWDHHPVHLHVQCRDGTLKVLDVLQGNTDQQGVVLAEAAL